MAVIVAVYDQSDRLIRIERQEANVGVSSAPLLNPNNLLGPRFGGTVFSAALELNAFDQITRDISDSSALTPAQREQALAVFRGATVGDSFAFVRETPVVVQMGDGAPIPAPVIQVFVDP